VFFTELMIAARCAFIAWELFGTRNPVVDLRILRNRSVAAGSVLALGAAVFGSIHIRRSLRRSLSIRTSAGDSEPSLILASISGSKRGKRLEARRLVRLRPPSFAST
jgi:hypothetical protein